MREIATTKAPRPQRQRHRRRDEDRRRYRPLHGRHRRGRLIHRGRAALAR
ncbi:hypothetical protein [Nocardioides convexus]